MIITAFPVGSLCRQHMHDDYLCETRLFEVHGVSTLTILKTIKYVQYIPYLLSQLHHNYRLVEVSINIYL